MGKKIIWTNSALGQLEDIHFYIFFESTEILKTQPEIYKLDKQKTNNDGCFRVYSVYDYAVSYQITKESISILRVRHNAQKPKKHSWKV